MERSCTDYYTCRAASLFYIEIQEFLSCLYFIKALPKLPRCLVLHQCTQLMHRIFYCVYAAP